MSLLEYTAQYLHQRDVRVLLTLISVKITTLHAETFVPGYYPYLRELYITNECKTSLIPSSVRKLCCLDLIFDSIDHLVNLTYLRTALLNDIIQLPPIQHLYLNYLRVHELSIIENLPLITLHGRTLINSMASAQSSDPDVEYKIPVSVTHFHLFGCTIDLNVLMLESYTGSAQIQDLCGQRLTKLQLNNLRAADAYLLPRTLRELSCVFTGSVQNSLGHLSLRKLTLYRWNTSEDDCLISSLTDLYIGSNASGSSGINITIPTSVRKLELVCTEHRCLIPDSVTDLTIRACEDHSSDLSSYSANLCSLHIFEYNDTLFGSLAHMTNLTNLDLRAELLTNVSLPNNITKLALETREPSVVTNNSLQLYSLYLHNVTLTTPGFSDYLFDVNVVCTNQEVTQYLAGANLQRAVFDVKTPSVSIINQVYASAASVTIESGNYFNKIDNRQPRKNAWITVWNIWPQYYFIRLHRAVESRYGKFGVKLVLAGLLAVEVGLMTGVVYLGCKLAGRPWKWPAIGRMGGLWSAGILTGWTG